MDPLVLVDQAVAQGKMSRPLARVVRRRMSYLAAAVDRTEKASGLKYPPYYLEPVLPVAKSGVEFGQMGVLFARVIPTTATGKLSILVQFTAALVAYGGRGTLDAVAAHEFTHYVDLVRRLSKASVVSDERAGTLFEAGYADAERTVPPALLFADKALVGLVRRKFKGGLTDPALNKKVGDRWIAKNLPVRLVPPEENVVKLGMGTVVSSSFDGGVLRKIAQMEAKIKR